VTVSRICLTTNCTLAMKLPKWLLWLAISSSAGGPCLAAAWWWVYWPERVLRQFSALVAQENFEQSGELLSNARWEKEAHALCVYEQTSDRYIGPAAIFTRSDGTPKAHTSSEWLCLHTATKVMVFPPISAHDFVLPPSVWRIWFRAENLQWPERTWTDYLYGRARLRAVDGYCELVATRGKIRVQADGAVFLAFIMSRNYPTARSKDLPYDVWMGSSIRVELPRLAFGEDEGKVSEFLGPPQRAANCSP